MEKEIESTVDQLRRVNRECMRGVQTENRATLLKQKRLRLWEIEQNAKTTNLEEFKDLLVKLKSRKASLNVLRKIKNACTTVEYIETFFRTEGAFDALNKIIISNDAEKQLEATSCLTNLSCGKHKTSYKITKRCGAYLISFINGSSHFLKDQSAWALGNLAADCVECFNILKAQGIVLALTRALKISCPSIQSVIFALNVCMEYENLNVEIIKKTGIANNLLALINQQNVSFSLLMDALFILVRCCYVGVLNNLEFINYNAAENLVACLKAVIIRKMNILVLIPLLRCLGYLSCNEGACMCLLENESFRECFAELMATDYYNFAREILWILTNILCSDFCTPTTLHTLISMQNLKILLKPGHPFVLQVLYFLLCLASKETNLITREPDVISFLNYLSSSVDKSIQEASQRVLTLINSEL